MRSVPWGNDQQVGEEVLVETGQALGQRTGEYRTRECGSDQERMCHYWAEMHHMMLAADQHLAERRVH